jgi:hypothetical protein
MDDDKILPDGQLVDIYAPVDADGDIVVMIGEEVFFEGTLKSLGEIQQFPDDIEHNSGHYYLYLSNMSMHILPGHYDNFIVGYVGNDGYVTANIKSMDSKDYINVYGNSSIEFSHNIAFLTGGNGSASITLVGATVSQDNISVEGHPEAVIHFENNVITVSNLTSGSYDLKVTTTPVSEYFYSVDGFAKIFVKTPNSILTSAFPLTMLLLEILFPLLSVQMRLSVVLSPLRLTALTFWFLLKMVKV